MTGAVGGGTSLALPAAARGPARPRPRAVPDAAEHALAGLGRLCLKGFLVGQFLSLTRLFFANHFGDGVAYVASQAGGLSVVLLFPAVLIYGLQSGGLFGTLIDKAQHWAVAVTGLSLLLFAYGWLVKGYAVTEVVHDLSVYIVIVAATILGSQPRAWKDIDRLVLVLFAIGLVVNALGMSEITTVLGETTAEDRAGPSVVGYRTQGALAFWSLLLLTVNRRRPFTALLIFAGAVFVAGQQVLFQKRSPSVRIALVVTVFLVILPWLRPRGHFAPGELSDRWIRWAFLGMCATGVAAALFAAPWLFRGQAAGLWQRLSGERYSGGATGMLTWENERFFEVGMFFRDLEPQELILGRGFGGYFVPDTPGWGGYLEDVNVVGRRALHVGALMPLFKGGLVLFLTYYAGLLLVLLRGRQFLREPFAAAAFFVVLLHALFLLQEGWFIMSLSFDLVLVGMCMGYLLSRERDAGRPWPWPKHRIRGLVSA